VREPSIDNALSNLDKTARNRRAVTENVQRLAMMGGLQGQLVAIRSDLGVLDRNLNNHDHMIVMDI
jgi:hypothetical protein